MPSDSKDPNEEELKSALAGISKQIRDVEGHLLKLIKSPQSSAAITPKDLKPWLDLMESKTKSASKLRESIDPNAFSTLLDAKIQQYIKPTFMDALTSHWKKWTALAIAASILGGVFMYLAVGELTNDQRYDLLNNIAQGALKALDKCKAN